METVLSVMLKRSRYTCFVMIAWSFRKRIVVARLRAELLSLVPSGAGSRGSTTAAAREMMKITTISSRRVKPFRVIPAAPLGGNPKCRQLLTGSPLGGLGDDG